MPLKRIFFLTNQEKHSSTKYFLKIRKLTNYKLMFMMWCYYSKDIICLTNQHGFVCSLFLSSSLPHTISLSTSLMYTQLLQPQVNFSSLCNFPLLVFSIMSSLTLVIFRVLKSTGRLCLTIENPESSVNKKYFV